MASKGGKAKDTVLDIQKWIEQPVRVKFTGGREVTGTLQGFDALVNLVLDDADLLSPLQEIIESLFPSDYAPVGVL